MTTNDPTTIAMYVHARQNELLTEAADRRLARQITTKTRRGSRRQRVRGRSLSPCTAQG